jgi:hypothetical protein
MDQTMSTIIAASVPTSAIIAAFVRNESALGTMGARIRSLETRFDTRIENLDRDVRARIETLDRDVRARIETLDRDVRARIETLDRDLREWARITMQINTDVARLKDKAGLD